MTDKSRIEKIIQTFEMADGQFAQEIGIQNSTLSHILNGRNRPSLDVIKKILKRFPEIDPDWLIFGHSSMLRKISQPASPNLFDNVDQTSSKTEDYPSVATNFPSNDPDINEKKAVRSTPEAPYFRTHRTNQDTNQDDSQPFQKADQTPISQRSHLQSEDKKVTKIILYFSDHTFQEFESK